MTKVNIDLTSKIVQEDDSETFNQQVEGEVKIDGETIRISYLENGEIPVKMLLKGNELIIRRGVDSNNY